MDKIMRTEEYRKGYIAGYRAGLVNGQQGNYTDPVVEEYGVLPVGYLNLSTRANNCLQSAGCTTVLDVAEMDEMKFLAIRNLGIKSTQEIAAALDAINMCYGAWRNYLK